MTLIMTGSYRWRNKVMEKYIGEVVSRHGEMGMADSYLAAK
jgi:hypothetical protein